MTDAKKAAEAMHAASFLARHSDDTFPELARAVVKPLASRSQDVANGTAYEFADGSVLHVTDSDGGSFASMAELERQLGVERVEAAAAMRRIRVA